jgi:EAL and modified HD-GYP domain-containing signal transduction protein
MKKRSDTPTPPLTHDKAVVARQPICDRDQNTFAYEFLFRKPEELAATIDNPDRATAQVIVNSFMEIGLDRMAGRSMAFINVTREFILENYCRSLPKDRVVFEILEDTKVDDVLLRSVAALTKEGYTFALDDYTFEDRMQPLLPFCRFIKVDARQTTPDIVTAKVGALKKLKVKLLAEKLETADEFDFYKQQGFEYFQGFFFCKPRIFSSARISRNRVAVSRLLAKLHQPGVDTHDIENAVSEDLSLSYQLLRYINSAAIALPKQIESIGHAVRLVGMDQIRLLASLMMLASVDDKPQELLTTSLVRARMCELVAQQHNYPNANAYFTVGLFSTLDAFLDCRLDEALKLLPLSDSIRGALLTYDGTLGTVLKRVLSYETGDWEALDELRADSAPLGRAYLRALEFGENLVQQINAIAPPAAIATPA